MSFNKKFFTTGGIVASTPPAAAGLDPLQNFETVAYTGNGGTQKITGHIRKGAAFNGSSSYISTGINFSTLPNTKSISMWIKSTGSSSVGFGGVNGSSANNGLFAFDESAGNVAYIPKFGGYHTGDASAVITNAWNHFVVTDTNVDGNVKMYINGSEVTVTKLNSTVYVNNTNMQIGRQMKNNGTLFWHTGTIDQVRIFDKAVSSSEVTTLYNEDYDSSTKSTTDIFGDGSGVALYELDEDANDTGVPIDSGQSAVFDGSTSVITLPSAINTLLGNKVFSVSLWVKDNGSVSDTVFSSGGANTFFLSANWTSAGNYALDNGSGSGTVVLGAVTNDWVHIVLNSNGSSGVEAFLNGVSKGTLAYRNADDPITTIGNLRNIGFYFTGSIDQVRIYSSALSSGDITNLYNESNVPTANLVAHYKLDGNANDETTNYNGTWSGTEAYSDPALLTAYNGTPTNVNFLGMAFQPDLVWTKSRTGLAWWHFIQDSVRGTTKAIYSNNTEPEGTFTDAIQSFDSNGYTIGSTGSLNYDSSNTYVAWCWKAGGAAVSNTDGTITSTVSANQDAGFSIVSYTGDGSGNNTSTTVGHGLSSAPELVIAKILDTTGNWQIQYAKDSDNLAGSFSTAAFINHSAVVPTSTVFNPYYANSSNNFITYCFHSVDDYQKVGTYTGNGTSKDIVTGFRPRFVMIKSTTEFPTSWVMIDSLRDNADEWLYANESSATFDDANTYTQFNSNGFTVNLTASYVNALNGTYIYLAIA